MVNEVIDILDPKDKQIFVDATFGQGGYTKKILDHSYDSKVIAIDRDEKAKVFAKEFEITYKKRFFFLNERFSFIKHISEITKRKIDGIVFDLGLCNTQLHSPSRGFSFNIDGPLDMRMGKQHDNSITAEKIVNNYSERELSNIFYEFGEEKKSFKIAKAIVKKRKSKRIKTTLELSKIINELGFGYKYRLNDSTRTFQALRIFINNELGELKETLEYIPKILKKNGKVIVIAFHSLEDKIVKNFFKENSGIVYNNYRNLPPNKKNKKKIFSILTKKPMKPKIEEIKNNPQSRSAKLRAAIKI